MKKVLLTLPIKGPRSPTERHEAGEILIATDQETKNILRQNAGVILESLPEPEVRIDADTKRGQPVLRNPPEQNSVGSGGRIDQDRAFDNSRSGNKQPAAKNNNRPRKKK